MAYSYIWVYRVRPEYREAFISAYRPGGDWCRLFAKAQGYQRTELLCDRNDRCRFVTIDYWDDEDSWRRFREKHAVEFEALDTRCETFTLEENEFGRFDLIPPE